RDSFFLATVSETGWPHVQHRGGPAGFLRVLDATTLAFADFSGNRQYVSVGNLAANDRAALILMDYPNQRRLKILGHVEVIDMTAVDAELLAKMQPLGREVERILRIRVVAFDWNCSRHITPRFTASEWQSHCSSPTDTSTTKE
ncbi:MAG TPA: pyridoxamine 5'-phosphate oxidase family protein, partial [Azonexus sp.]|nr:pyridoxamine 5'-phosphate oxidase family protein [Azonexus sp.]